MEKPKYYRYIIKNDFSFTYNKIYKLQNSLEKFETYGSFIDNRGNLNGFAGENYKHFIPATEEEYFIQEGIVIPIFNYNKLINILDFINNYEKN